MAETEFLTTLVYTFKAKRCCKGGYWIKSAGRWKTADEAATAAGLWLSHNVAKAELWAVKVIQVEELNLLAVAKGAD